MESTGARPDDVDPAAQVRELERAEALPYVVYPKTPRWYPPAMALYLGGLVSAFALWRSEHVVVFAVLVILITAFGAGVIGAVRARYEAFPRLGADAPREIRAAYRRYFVGLAVVVAAVALAWAWAGAIVAGVATFVLVAAGLSMYENHYAAAATGARTRLGIDAA